METYEMRREAARHICKVILDPKNRPKPPEGEPPISGEIMNTAIQAIDGTMTNGQVIDAILESYKENLKHYANLMVLYTYCYVLYKRAKRKTEMKK